MGTFQVQIAVLQPRDVCFFIMTNGLKGLHTFGFNYFFQACLLYQSS